MRCDGSLDDFLGRLAATLGDAEEARRRLARAAADNARIGAAPRAELAQRRLRELEVAERG